MPMSPGDVEPVEGERVAARDDRAGGRSTRERQRGDDVVGYEHADDVGIVGGVEVSGLEPVGRRLFARLVAPYAHDR